MGEDLGARPPKQLPGCEPCVSEDRHACADSRLNPGHAVFDDGTPRRFRPHATSGMKEEVRVRFNPSDLRGAEQMRLELRKQPGEAQTRKLDLVRSVVPFQTLEGYRRLSEEGWQFRVEPDAPIAYLRMTGRDTAFYQNVILGDAIRAGFTSLFQYGVFDLFPELRVVILEIGAGWIGYWIERMDAVYESPHGKSVPLRHKPSEYFRQQCWISGDPDERSVAGVIPVVGEDRFFWASDFPHADHPPNYIPNLIELVNRLPESARPKLLGQNVLNCYSPS